MGQRNVKRLYDASQAGGTPITPIAAGTGAIGTNASIPPGVGMALVASTSAAERVNLPLNVIGTILTIFETTSVGYELITTTVSPRPHQPRSSATSLRRSISSSTPPVPGSFSGTMP